MNMKLIVPIALMILCCFSACPDGRTQGWLHAVGKEIRDDRGNDVLLRGIGLGGWMLQEGYMLGVRKDAQQYRIRQRLDTLAGSSFTDLFYDQWLHNFVSRTDIDSLRSWGFNSVRLPMHFNLYTLATWQEPFRGQNTWLEKGFAITDSLLAWCKANRIYLILDMHATPGGQGNDLNISDRDPSRPSLWEDPANRQKLVELWKRLAARYAEEPWIGGYDIINEPNWGFTDPVNDRNGVKEKNNALLRDLMMDITRAIRSVDRKHMIIIEGNGWGNNYNGVLPLWDDNLVMSFHRYWVKNDLASIRHILDAREQNNVPVWLGETGENDNTWFAEAVALLEGNRIGWSWWPLKKMGASNPLQVKSNPFFDKITAWMNGRGARPTAEESRKGLELLTQSIRTENNIYHREVIDALFGHAQVH